MADVAPHEPQVASDYDDRTGKLQSGALNLTFSLYEEQNEGSPLWVETQKVELDEQGHYTVLLGSTSPQGLPLDLFASGKARWLGVQPQLPAEGEQPAHPAGRDCPTLSIRWVANRCQPSSPRNR
jgi:hypothetical protein